MNSFNVNFDEITLSNLIKKLIDRMYRYTFFSRKQREDESVNDFIGNISLNCEFKELRERI